MQPPSLYGHFASKNAIYDAMFQQAWESWYVELQAMSRQLPTGPRARLIAGGQAYFEYAVADPERHTLMDVRALPGFTPSPTAYEASLGCYDLMRQLLPALSPSRPGSLHGAHRRADQPAARQ
jgi:AcrR family transcriptional regulator